MPKNLKKKSEPSSRLAGVLKKPFMSAKKRSASFLLRRPHRSFRLTRRRDYKRSLKLPGYFKFTHDVHRTVWQYRKPLIALTVIYIVFSALLVGIASQDTYTTLTTTLRDTGSEIFEGNLGQIGQAGLLFATIATSGLSNAPSEAQQIFAGLLILLVWLTTVWLMRNLLAGHKVKVRDGLYSAGAPLISTALVTLVLFVQLLPLALAVIGYSAALASGLLNGGVEAMLFWISAGLLTLLSLYWITSTFFALIVVTLPGMYPMRALRTAGDMVVGRRLRILLRLLWMSLCVALTWALILIPFILLDSWLKGVWPQIEWLPIIPVILLFMSTATVVWVACYVYLLYRKVVDDDAKPA